MKTVRGLELHRVFPQCLPSVTTVRRHKELFVPGTEASHFSPFYDYAQVDLCLSGGVFSTKTKFLTVFIFMIDCKNLFVSPYLLAEAAHYSSSHALGGNVVKTANRLTAGTTTQLKRRALESGLSLCRFSNNKEDAQFNF